MGLLSYLTGYLSRWKNRERIAQLKETISRLDSTRRLIEFGSPHKYLIKQIIRDRRADLSELLGYQYKPDFDKWN